MDGVGRRPGPWWLPLIRWTLLTGVMAGLFGMHVLTAETSAGGHGALPHTMSMSSPTGHTPAGDDPVLDAGSGPHTSVAAIWPAAFAVQMAPVVAAGPSPSDGHGAGHAGLGGCVLFLVIGGALTLLALLASRAWNNTDRATPVSGAAVRLPLRRGPPGRYRPRVALCVIRV